MKLLERAIQLHHDGLLFEAETAYREALLAEPENADGWHLFGVFSQQCGQSEQALQWIEQALALAPEKAAYWNDLGVVQRALHHPPQALASFQKALSIQPIFPECMFNLAALWSVTGESGQAMALFQKALVIKPDDPDGLLQYGLALMGSMRFEDAAEALAKAVSVASRSLDAAFFLGSTLESAGRFADAVGAYERAAALAPNEAEVWSRWGRLLIGQEQFEKAIPVLKTAVTLVPKNGLDQFYLGYALQCCGRPVEALPHCQAAAAARPGDAEVHNHLGLALKDVGKLVEAAQSFHRAIAIAPGLTSALNNLGAVCNELGLSSEALDCFEVVIARQPNSPGALSNIGKILKDRGRAKEGVAYFRRALSLQPNSRAFITNLLLGLQYIAEPGAQEIYEEHRKWGTALAKRSGQPYSHVAHTRDGARRIRVGYVSADFCVHPVAVFLEGLFEQYDRAAFEVFCYSDVSNPDAVTQRLKALVDAWRDTAGMDAAALAEAVSVDAVDILVDLSGHTAGNRLEMFALKPAPIQVSYLGYPSTTGLAAMDYRMTDSIVDPPGMTEHFHVEELLRLDRAAWCFRAPTESPDVGPSPLGRNGFVTFGCFNQLAKLNVPLFERWSEILQRVPGSRLKLKARSLMDPVVREELAQFFVQRGIDAQRLEFSGFAPSVKAHLAEYQQVDIALDSYPYHGTTTTCEALWMGVPVISQAGGTHVSRVGASLLDAAGLGEMSVENEWQYVEAAVLLAQQPERLAYLRGELRSRMSRSPLMDAMGFTRSVEQRFREIWMRFCVDA